LTKLLVLAALALAVTASSGSAASPTRTRLLGVVPHGTGSVLPLVHALPNAFGLAGPATLTFDAHYETLINQYFADVAHDSAGIKNVYSVATQYTDGSGPVQYRSTFGGSYVDHDPLPPNGCDDGVDRYCLSDNQLQVEIQSVLTAKSWQGGLDHIFFLMTPNGVGSCEFDGVVSDANPCSTNAFCAYHNFFGNAIGDAFTVIYANEPYMGPLPPGACTNPKDQGFPNDDVDAETTINTISHEHNEAITDPLGDGWVELGGIENGDLCAYGFGTQTSGTAGVDAFNQTINGHNYELQQEFSNEEGPQGGCVQFRHGPATQPPPGNGKGPLPYNGGPVMHTNKTYAIYWLPTPGNQTPPAVTGKAGIGQTLKTSPGTWNGGATGFHDQWQRCSSVGASCVNIPGATAAAYKLTSTDSGHTLRSTVSATNVNGTSPAATSATTAVVVDIPAITKPPHVSGRARVGKKLTGSHGSWTHSPTFHLQWLRCNAHGGHCSSIHHATHSTYRLTKHDAGHRLRLRVTATNAAGSRTALSTASARVPAPKKH
jgi:hypothetical protein